MEEGRERGRERGRGGGKEGGRERGRGGGKGEWTCRPPQHQYLLTIPLYFISGENSDILR